MAKYKDTFLSMNTDAAAAGQCDYVHRQQWSPSCSALYVLSTKPVTMTQPKQNNQ